MAKKVNEWYQIIVDQYVAEMANAGVAVNPSAWSVANHQRVFLYVMAIVAFMSESLRDIFRTEIDATIAAMKPHSLQWYAEMSKKFQYGDNLVNDSDKYDNSRLTDAQIKEKQIVAYAAVVEQERGLRLKVAKVSGNDLDALDPAELLSFSNYMKRVKDAGVKLLITSGPADALRLVMRVVYNPLVLNAAGARIDGTSMAPIKEAIKEHLLNLPFNGVFSVQKLIDTIQSVEGVDDLNLDEVQTKYGLLPFISVDISAIPDSGYLRIADENLTINYIAG